MLRLPAFRLGPANHDRPAGRLAPLFGRHVLRSLLPAGLRDLLASRGTQGCGASRATLLSCLLEELNHGLPRFLGPHARILAWLLCSCQLYVLGTRLSSTNLLIDSQARIPYSRLTMAANDRKARRSDDMESKQCRDCEKPIPTYEERCVVCWRELEAEFEPDPLEQGAR